MKGPARRGLLGVVAGASVAAYIFAPVVYSAPLPPFPFDPFSLIWVGFPIVGALLLVKRPGNRIGSLLLAIGICAGASMAATAFVSMGVGPLDFLVLANQVIFTPVFFLISALVLLFPSGEVPPRWRTATALTAIFAALFTVWTAVRPVDYSVDNETFYPNPLGIGVVGPADPWVIGVAQLILGGFGLAALIKAVRDYRKAGPQRRLQTKWVIAPVVAMIVLFVTGILVDVLGTEGSVWSNLFTMSALLIGFPGIATGIGVAVLRHNLYEIDRLVSRTVTYAVVVGMLGVTYLAMVTALTIFLPSDAPLVVAVATLAVAALFNPLRRRVQAGVERRFNRARFDVERVMNDFAATLQHQLDTRQVAAGWVDVVETTMQPAVTSVWVKEVGSRPRLITRPGR